MIASVGAAQVAKVPRRGGSMALSQSTRYDSSSSLVSIQALRAIAALLVFWGHAINAVHLKVDADFPHLYGPFGVDLFFVISGFVMVYSSERLFGRPGAPMTFFVRRLARIVPLYRVATAVLVSRRRFPHAGARARAQADCGAYEPCTAAPARHPRRRRSLSLIPARHRR